jgi:hypothetical protein
MTLVTSNNLETRIAKSIVDAALSLGYAITVSDGEETAIRKSISRSDILNVMNTTDSDTLGFSKGDSACFGMIWLVWGNDEDLISDASDHPDIEAIIATAEHMRKA